MLHIVNASFVLKFLRMNAHVAVYVCMRVDVCVFFVRESL